MNATNTPCKRPRLGLEIATVIACKLCFIFALWFLFFSPEHRTHVDAERMSEAVFSRADSLETPPTTGQHR